MHAFFRRSHQTVKQGDVQAVKILQCVEHAELRPQVEMKRGVTNGSEIEQDDVSMCLLKGESSVYRSGGASRAAFGAQECEDAGFPGSAE